VNRIESLGLTPLVGLARFDHPDDHPHRDPHEEVAGQLSVSFVERGVFDVHVGREEWRLYPGTLFVTLPGMVYRTSHGEELPRDRCLTLSWAPQAVPPALVRGLPVMLRGGNRWAYLHWRAARAASTDDALGLESLAGEIANELAAWNGAGRARKSYGRSQLGWYAERVQFVRELLENAPAERHSLGTLAGAVGMSPFHFSRVFHELVGMPPHRYLLGVRLASAARLLRAGKSVTDASGASGFSNLSHFIRSFRRRFGVTPSRYRPR
jgi:AraC-like DNA-binding protein